MDTCQGIKQVRNKFYPRFIQADEKKPLRTRFSLDKLKSSKLKNQGLTKKVDFTACWYLVKNPEVYKHKNRNSSLSHSKISKRNIQNDIQESIR